MPKAIIISGPFDVDDIEFFARIMRMMERKRPHENYRMIIKDLERELSMEELADEIDRIFPTLPDDTPVKAVIRRRVKH